MSLNNERLPDPPASGFESDEAAHEYGRQLAMDLVLQHLYHPSTENRRDRKVVKWITRVSLAAAAMLVVGTVFLFQGIYQKTPDAGRWEVEPVTAAEFSVVEPYHVRLDRGELRVPAAPAPRMVTVETGFATVTAMNAEFRIRLVDDPRSPSHSPGPLKVATIEIVSGKVTLTTPQGSIIGKAGETLIAVEGGEPRKE